MRTQQRAWCWRHFRQYFQYRYPSVIIKRKYSQLSWMWSVIFFIKLTQIVYAFIFGIMKLLCIREAESGYSNCILAWLILGIPDDKVTFMIYQLWHKYNMIIWNPKLVVVITTVSAFDHMADRPAHSQRTIWSIMWIKELFMVCHKMS